MYYQNKVILITGSGSGLGRELAVNLARQGSILILTGRREEKLKETLHLCVSPEKHLIVKCDITMDCERDALFHKIREKYGRLNILINNAAVCTSGDLTELNENHIQKVIKTNLTSVILMSQRALPLLKESKQSVIINIGSVASYCAFPYHTIYTAAKFGLKGFTRSLRAELLASDLKVLLIYPGAMKTDMISTEFVEEGKKLGFYFEPPEKTACKIIKAARGKKETVYIQTLRERISGYIFTKHPLLRDLILKKNLSNFKKSADLSNIHTTAAI